MTEPITVPRAIDPAADVYNASLVRREDETESLSYLRTVVQSAGS